MGVRGTILGVYAEQTGGLRVGAAFLYPRICNVPASILPLCVACLAGPGPVSEVHICTITIVPSAKEVPTETGARRTTSRKGTRDSSNRSRSASRFGSLVATTRTFLTAALSRSSRRGSHSSGRPCSVCPWLIVSARSMRPALLRTLRLTWAVTRDCVVAAVRSPAISGSTTSPRCFHPALRIIPRVCPDLGRAAFSFRSALPYLVLARDISRVRRSISTISQIGNPDDCDDGYPEGVQRHGCEEVKLHCRKVAD